MNKEIDQGAAINRDRISSISLVIICSIFPAITRVGVALFLPLIRQDLGLSFTQGGSLSAVTILIYAFMQMPAGYLADRFGAKKVFFAGILGTAIFCLTFSQVTMYWQAIINQIIIGFFSGLLFAPSIVLLTGWFGPERRATAMGLFLIGIFIGDVLVNTTGPLLANEYSWRFPFIVFSLAGIVASIIYLQLGKLPSNIGSQQKIDLRTAVKLLRYRFMWLFAIIQYVRLAVLRGITFWLPTLLMHDKGISLQVTGFIVALRATMIAPSNMIGGYVSDRIKKPLLIIGLSLTMLAITSALFGVVDNIVLLIALILLNAIFVQFYFGPLFSTPTSVLGEHMQGTTAGFGNFFANIGGFTFVYLLGVLKDATGLFSFGFYSIAGSCVIGLIATALLAKTRQKIFDIH